MHRLGKSTGWTVFGAIAFANIDAAEAPAPVDEDFLEYLGTLDDGGDWTLFEGEETKPRTAAEPKPAHKPREDDAKSVSEQTASKQK